MNGRPMEPAEKGHLVEEDAPKPAGHLAPAGPLLHELLFGCVKLWGRRLGYECKSEENEAHWNDQQ